MTDLQTLTAADLMTTRIELIDPDAVLRTAASRMTALGIHCLMVPASRPDQAFGILTCKDVIRVLIDAPEASLDELTVAEAMTTPALTLPDFLCVHDCIRMMCMMGVRQAFILEGRDPVGLLSFTDILAAVSEDKSL